MSVTTTNIYSGPVTTFKIGGTDIGGTNDGVVVNREDEFADLHCDQILGPVTKKLVSRKFTVETRLAEITLANLEKALGQESGNLVSSSLGLDEDEQGSVTLEIAVPCPTGVGTRTIKFDTCYNVTGGATEYKKDGTQTVIPVTFDCLPNSSGVYGYISDAA
jgi:hypothetical protein